MRTNYLSVNRKIGGVDFKKCFIEKLKPGKINFHIEIQIQLESKGNC